MILNILNSVF